MVEDGEVGGVYSSNPQVQNSSISRKIGLESTLHLTFLCIRISQFRNELGSILMKTYSSGKQYKQFILHTKQATHSGGQ
jgi:hypothetical protein